VTTAEASAAAKRLIGGLEILTVDERLRAAAMTL